MVIQIAEGWLLDVVLGHSTDDIILFIKLKNGKIVRFKKKLGEYGFYILPRSYRAAQDLFQQLSRNEHLIKRVFWDEKYIDLQDKNKTSLIGIGLNSNDRQGFKTIVQKLGHDSRVKSIYNIDISEVIQFIYARLKIPPTSKVEIEYDDEDDDDDDTERLLSISKIDDSEEISPPPFSVAYIEQLNKTETETEPIELSVRANGQTTTTTTISVNSLSDPVLISYISQIEPDIIFFGGEDLNADKVFAKLFKEKVIIRIRNNAMPDPPPLLELVEKSRFSYLPLGLASKYGMLRLIDSRITFELLQREFVIPPRMKTASKHHEQIRTLEDIVEMDKAGLIVSPEIGLHENVAVLDYDDEYANLVLRYNISYEAPTHDSQEWQQQQQQNRSGNETQMLLLPAIMNEIVSRRIYLKKQLEKELKIKNSFLYDCCQIRLEILKQILVCLYGTSGSVWNRYSNVQVFEEINKYSRQILLKTKDVVQQFGFELIYADTDAVFLKKKDATRSDYEDIMNVLIKETGLNLTLEYYYKFLVLLYIEADEKMEARKHYYGLTYDNRLITRGIDTRRHDLPAFLKEFQTTLLSILFFNCKSYEEVLTNGYQNALLCITHSIDKIMNGEIKITDLVISKQLRQNIEKYGSLFPHVAAAIKLNISGVDTKRGDNIEYVYADSNHTDPLQRIIPARLLISSENYDKEKYLEMLFDSAEAVLSVFGFNRSLFGFEMKKNHHWWHEIIQQRKRDIETAKSEL